MYSICGLVSQVYRAIFIIKILSYTDLIITTINYYYICNLVDRLNRLGCLARLPSLFFHEQYDSTILIVSTGYKIASSDCNAYTAIPCKVVVTSHPGGRITTDNGENFNTALNLHL